MKTYKSKLVWVVNGTMTYETEIAAMLTGIVLEREGFDVVIEPWVV